MAKKEKKEALQAPQVNPEIQEAEKEYRRGVAMIEARPKLRRAFLFVWAFIDVILLSIFLGYLGFYLAVASFTERQHVARIGANIGTLNAITSARSAQSLQISDVQVFSLSGTEHDLHARIENVNSDWYATFDYSFVRGDEQSDVRSGFVLPNEERPLIAFRQAFSSRPATADLVIENLEWHRVDHHAIDDIGEWLEDHNGFTLSEDTYALDHQVSGETVGRSTFTVKNNSPYGYFNAEFLVLIVRGNVVAGVNTATVAGFEAGESRDVTVNWFDGAPSSGDVVVIPNINYFDEDVYMSLPSDSQGDIRDRF